MKKRDIIIIAVFLVVAIVGMAGAKLLVPKGNITYADIYINNALYEAVPLNKNTVITVDQGDGKVNHVEVKGGAIFMADSTCSDGLCISQGKMSPENYEDRPMLNWIICLPNQVTVQLRVDEE
jgi:hypothetical protein